MRNGEAVPDGAFFTKEFFAKIRETINKKSDPDEYIKSILDLIKSLELELSDLLPVNLSLQIVDKYMGIVGEQIESKGKSSFRDSKLRQLFFEEIVMPYYLSLADRGESEPDRLMFEISDFYNRHGNTNEKSMMVESLIEMAKSRKVNFALYSNIAHFWYMSQNTMAEEYILSLDYKELKKVSENSYKKGVLILMWTLSQSSSNKSSFRASGAEWSEVISALDSYSYVHLNKWGEGEILSRLAIETIVNAYKYDSRYEAVEVVHERLLSELRKSIKSEEDPYIKVLAAYKLFELDAIKNNEERQKLKEVVATHIEQAKLPPDLAKVVKKKVAFNAKKGLSCKKVLKKSKKSK